MRYSRHRNERKHISSKRDENAQKYKESREWEQVITKQPIPPSKIK
jgi:hypothetical protein